MHSYYDEILLTGDFKTEIYDHYLETFLYEHELKSLVKQKICSKIFQTQVVSCIDLFLTNNLLFFKALKQ